MPAIKDIDKLKDKLNSLGNELAIMAESGQKIQDVKPAEEGLSDDISALLGSFSEDLQNQDSDNLPADFDDSLTLDNPGLDSSLSPDIDSNNLELDSDFNLDELNKSPDFDIDLPETLPEIEDPDSAGGSEAPLFGDEVAQKENQQSIEDTSSEENELGSLENLFGDNSLDIDDNPDVLLDRFAEKEEPSASSDDFDLGSLDDIFDDKEQDSGSALETLDSVPDEDEIEEAEPAADIAESNEIDAIEPDQNISSDEDFSLPDDFNIDFTPDSLDDETDNNEQDNDLELSEPLPDIEPGDKDFDLGSLDSVPNEGTEDDFQLPEIDSADLSTDEDFTLGPLDSGQGSGEKEEEFQLPEIGSDDLSADEDFDIGSLDTISMDDEFEKTEQPGSNNTSIDEAGNETGDVGELEGLDQEDSSLNNDFNLEDFGDKFGSVDDLEDTHLGGLSEKTAAEPGEEKDETAAEEISKESYDKPYISAEKLNKVTAALALYPGNLKYYIEDLIGNRDIPKNHLDNLVDKLAAGSSAREISELLFKITGKRIRIPAQYERKTWQELEKEKGTLSYILRYQIIPFMGKALAVSFAILFALFIINNFIWKPIYSSWLYKKGYEALINENYTESEKNFLKATKVKPVKKQFYKYADALTEKREYTLSEKKYLQLLGTSLSSEREKPAKERLRGFFRGDKKGFIDYSVLKTYYQGDYSSAEHIIDDFLYIEGNKWDSDMLLKKIDNYLNWAEVDNTKYDNAEYVINDSISKFGIKPDYYLRKITLAVRSGKLQDMRNEAFSDVTDIAGDGISSEKRRYFGTLNQYRGYIEGLKKQHVDPYISSDFYGYLITEKNNIDGIDRDLIKIANIDKSLLEPHYQLARLWNFLERPEMERESLQIVEKLAGDDSLEHIRKEYPHSYMYARKQRKDFEITAFNRLGNFEYDDQNILSAQKYYQRAISEYERSIDILGVSPKYGKIYEDSGDIYYYSAGKYNDALREYHKAEATGYRENNLSYKIGFIYYRNKNYKEASERFYEISIDKRDNESVLFSFANASFYNNIYSPAMAYYEQVIERLEYWKNNQVLIELDRRRDQRLIMERLMQTYNNLGATLYKLSEKNKNSSYYSNSLVNLTKSAELYDLMSRDPETFNRSFTKPLAQLNLHYAFLNAGRPIRQTANNVIPYSSENIQMNGPVIYNEIDQDLFGRVEMITEVE